MYFCNFCIKAGILLYILFTFGSLGVVYILSTDYFFLQFYHYVGNNWSISRLLCNIASLKNVNTAHRITFNIWKKKSWWCKYSEKGKLQFKGYNAYRIRNMYYTHIIMKYYLIIRFASHFELHVSSFFSFPSWLHLLTCSFSSFLFSL